jgi:hypothetical protein
VVSDVRAGLSLADKWWLQVLGALLPAGFRDRQYGEWGADLLMLSHDPAARRRYLLGAARTLPALRAAARGHESVELARLGRPGAVTAWRVIATMLAWAVIGWLSTVLVPYLLLRTGGNASDFGGQEWINHPPPVLMPFVAVLFWGGLATMLGPVLTVATSVTGLVLAVAERRRSLEHRIGTGAVSAALLIFVAPVQLQFMERAAGDSLVLLALAALPLMTRRAGLSVRRRVLLGVLVTAAVAIVIVYRTSFGHDMTVWLSD